MLKVDFSDARVKARGDWTSEGSVLAGTVTSTCHGPEVEIDLESEETPQSGRRPRPQCQGRVLRRGVGPSAGAHHGVRLSSMVTPRSDVPTRACDYRVP
jgi:hypothetical protein